MCVCAHVGAVKEESLVWKECYKLYECVCVRTDVTGVRKKLEMWRKSDKREKQKKAAI